MIYKLIREQMDGRINKCILVEGGITEREFKLENALILTTAKLFQTAKKNKYIKSWI